MAGGSYLKTAYLFIGGTFSVFYLVVGLMLASGKLTFGMEPSVRVLVGLGIMAYGVFRAILFYKKYKESREEEN